MRRAAAIAAVLSAALIGGLIQSPSVATGRPVAPNNARIDGSRTVEYIIRTRHGHIFAEAVHPTSGGKIVKSPVVLTYSPYSVLGRNGDADVLVPRGYTRMYADVVGTGNSGGCYDYGGRREKQTGYDIVEWIAKQRWSTKRVAMEGGSYDGTTAIAAATQAPPHLTTIVPQVAISRWYGYAYSGGIRYLYTNEFAGNRGIGGATEEGFDTPLAFDFGFALPPPLDVANDEWAERVESSTTPCDELKHTEHGYDFDTPDYDRFWLQRDYIRSAGNIGIPVLIGGNWGDWNVKQEGGYNLFKALRGKGNRDAHLYFGSRWRGHQAPGGEFEKVMLSWLAHHLKGRRNGIGSLAPVTTQTADASGDGAFSSGRTPRTKNVRLWPQHDGSLTGYPWRLLPKNPRRAKGPEASFASLGANTEMGANAQPHANLSAFRFESPPLKRDVRLFGKVKVKLYSSVQRKWVTVTPTIVDVAPDSSSLVSVTRGFLDSRYRNGLGTTRAIRPGKPFPMTVVEKPTDYTFRKGHRIGLSVQTEINEWMVAKPYPGCDDASDGCAQFRVRWEGGRSRLVLPIVRAPRNPARLFERAGP
ncbi:MAG: CocE/NonD family hydrolase [Actinomycetota bacterium]